MGGVMNFLRNALSEGLGSLAFCFLFVFSGFVVSANGVSWLNPLLMGLCFMISYYCYVPYGRGHFDPSLGFSLVLTRKEGILEFVFNGIGQFLGCLAGTAFAAGAYLLASGNGLGDLASAYPTTSIAGYISGIKILFLFFLLVILAGVFAFLYLQIQSKKEYNAASGIVLALGLAVVSYMAAPFLEGGLSYSFNPFVTIASNIAAGYLGQAAPWSDSWVFVLAPFLGASFAAGVYVLLNHRLNLLRGIRVREKK